MKQLPVVDQPLRPHPLGVSLYGLLTNRNFVFFLSLLCSACLSAYQTTRLPVAISHHSAIRPRHHAAPPVPASPAPLAPLARPASSAPPVAARLPSATAPPVPVPLHAASGTSAGDLAPLTNITQATTSGVEAQKGGEPTSSRAAPVSVRAADGGLNAVLNFSERTAINFMHFHKTGGVSFKTSLHAFYGAKRKRSGARVRVHDACYARPGAVGGASTPRYYSWRCDWEPVQAMEAAERDGLDYTIGHQFWRSGIGGLLAGRDVRSFTVLRHPFDRKVSFFYHFFVRDLGRDDRAVSFAQIRDFLLFDRLAVKVDMGGDVGPNYMAGRLLSDGESGFVGNWTFRYFAVPGARADAVVADAVGVVRDFLFVGLQSEPAASKCMLRKVVERFNDVNGVDNAGVEMIDGDAAVLNSGSYSLSAEEIWRRFSAEDRALFQRNEFVDLRIFEEGERLFRKHARLYGCAHRVKHAQYLT